METIHVLMISDNQHDIEEVQALLTTGPDAAIHYHVDITTDYAEALRSLVRNRHGIVLLDYHLPGVNVTGVELLQRANAGGCSTPVILLSILPDEEMEWAADDAGAACYLNKNFDLNERTLKLAIRHGVKYFHKLQEMQELLTSVQKQLAELGRRFRRT
jgi:DNA-binding response OmpR family regulator